MFDIDMFNQLEIYIEKYKLLGKVFFIGDMKCRTAEGSDYITFDHFLDNNISLQANVDIRKE